MEVIKFDVTREKLKELQKDELEFFLTSTIFMDDILVLFRSFLIASNSHQNEKNEIVKQGHAIALSCFTKLLIGKYKEGWEMIKNKYFSNLSKFMNEQLSNEGKEALKELNTITKHSSVYHFIHNIRNDYAFHYSELDFNRILDEIPGDDDLSMYCTGHAINNLYSSGGALSMWELFKNINPDEQVQAFEVVSEIISNLFTHFNRFIGNCLALLALKAGINGKPVSIPDPKQIEEYEFPLFFKYEG